MDALPLADPVDASDSLFQADRVPRDLEVDHAAAAVVQVEPFTRGVGRKEDVSGAGGESTFGAVALASSQSTMQLGDPVGQNTAWR